jgi:hypothetical protein
MSVILIYNKKKKSKKEKVFDFLWGYLLFINICSIKKLVFAKNINNKSILK